MAGNMQQAFKAALPKILPLKATGGNLNEWLDSITVFLEFLDMIYLLWSGHNQVIKSPFDAAGPDYNREALTAEQKEFHSRFDKNIKEAFKVKTEKMTPAKEAAFTQDVRHFALSISASKGKKSSSTKTPQPPKEISSSSTSAQSGGEQQELPKPDSDDMELDEEEEGELIFQSINQPLLANECAISRLERRIVMEAVFKDPAKLMDLLAVRSS